MKISNKIFILTGLLFALSNLARAQKPVIDTAAISSWPKIGGESISSDGRFVAYYTAAGDAIGRLHLRDVEGSFKMDFPNVNSGTFTRDSKRLLVKMPGDSLGIVDLTSRQVVYECGIRSFDMPLSGDGELLVYTNLAGELLFYDLVSGTKKNLGRVQNYIFSNSGKVLLLEKSESTDNNTTKLEWLDLKQGKDFGFFSGQNISELTFDRSEDRVAFFANGKDGDRKTPQLFLYRFGAGSAELMVDSLTPGMEKQYQLDNGALEFSADGNKLFFWLRQVPSPSRPSAIGASVDIWNYKDETLQSDQLKNLGFDQFRGVVNTRTGKVLRLQQKKNEAFGMSKLSTGTNDAYLLTGEGQNTYENYYRAKDLPSYFLINTDDGTRTKIINRYRVDDIGFSPGGRYVVWFDPVKHAYMAYDIQLKLTKNISANIPVKITDELNDAAWYPRQYGIAFWIDHDLSVLIYDRYDIWQVDPTGVRKPVNLTNGYGRRHQIVLRCVTTTENDLDSPVYLGGTEKLLLCGLDEKAKRNGFFELDLRKRQVPGKLSMKPELTYFSGFSSFVNFPTAIQKAANGGSYLLRTMSATKYPNLVVTHDFKTFQPVSNLEPQEKYNWLTSELVRWKTFTGNNGEGILYKPENFDPRKKYPIIFFYYERMSDGLNNYLFPDLCRGSMNIPWFVSHGYLVCWPDIHYTPGDPGAGIYDYVVSAAKYMQKKPWVDGKHMGIQGHSFGGFETNQLVTRTTLFTAAASSAGVSDMISMSGDAGFGTCTVQGFVELGIFRMKTSLWQDPAAYIRNSAVFQANKVQTPLLILQNEMDNAVPWGQGVEFFTALRRLNKRVWMLQYDNQDHNMYGKSALDYTIRLTQYFDHYLKGASEPKWMSVGVPARLKGIDDGLELTQ